MNVATPEGFGNITPAELAALAPRPRIVDVREPDEFTGELGHIPGAELVPLATVLDAARPWRRDERIVVTCRSGGRSLKAASSLVVLGFTNLLNLDGGMQAYVEAGLPVER
jgi:rhodanese-related sulfurtransferase